MKRVSKKMREFKKLIELSHGIAKRWGLKKSDVTKTIKEVRERNRSKLRPESK